MLTTSCDWYLKGKRFILTTLQVIFLNNPYVFVWVQHTNSTNTSLLRIQATMLQRGSGVLATCEKPFSVHMQVSE